MLNIKSDLLNYMIKIRRVLHQNPETAFNEFQTQQLICNELDGFENFKYKKVQTGVIAEIYAKNAKSDLAVAFRADIDALSIFEGNSFDFVSKNKGVMHACGHDGHTAILLGFAKWLNDNAHNLSRNVRLIFQPAEEGEGGACIMIENGAIENVSEIFAIHIDPTEKVGVVGVTDGASMAGSVEFEIDIKGKSCHAAEKQFGQDAIKSAVFLVDRLEKIEQHLSSGKKCIQDGVLIHVGKIDGGTARNVVAENSKISVVMRYFDEQLKDLAMREIENSITQMNDKFGTIAKLGSVTNYCPVINSIEAVSKVENISSEVVKTYRKNAQYTAEDFAFYAKKVPGCLMWLGANVEGGTKLHTPTFNFDENAMLVGVKIFASLI